ncbi:MBL fold metallo-hydrolase [Pilimelia columellifera]|uniref:MBL fold metallo-hydrolase n=1 Tax=Pilimelia columellifera subsp. columellifera TaxID=706583 RepID=A0ABN3NID8_9ACTN
MTDTALAVREIADGVFALRHPELNVNAALVLGDGEALLVDTLSHGAQARRLAAAARRITGAPLTLVNTHHHFDHCWGNGVLADPDGRPVWAHENCRRRLVADGERLRERWRRQWAPTHPALAAGLAAAPLLVPTRTFVVDALLEVGGRAVTLSHPGPGHTDGDVVVHVPDVGVLIAGDLVEQGAPPDFEDGDALAWPAALDELLTRFGTARAVLPGHGDPVDLEFVAGQRDALAALAELLVAGHDRGATAEQIAERSSWPPAAVLPAARRALARLKARDPGR